MAVVDDLRALGAPVGDDVLVARFLDQLALTSQQKARTLRGYLRETGGRLSTEVLVAARNYSFYL